MIGDVERLRRNCSAKLSCDIVMLTCNLRACGVFEVLAIAFTFCQVCCSIQLEENAVYFEVTSAADVHTIEFSIVITPWIS